MGATSEPAAQLVRRLGEAGDDGEGGRAERRCRRRPCPPCSVHLEAGGAHRLTSRSTSVGARRDQHEIVDGRSVDRHCDAAARASVVGDVELPGRRRAKRARWGCDGTLRHPDGASRSTGAPPPAAAAAAARAAAAACRRVVGSGRRVRCSVAGVGGGRGSRCRCAGQELVVLEHGDEQVAVGGDAVDLGAGERARQAADASARVGAQAITLASIGS